jgi:hypothetical protein
MHSFRLRQPLLCDECRSNFADDGFPEGYCDCEAGDGSGQRHHTFADEVLKRAHFDRASALGSSTAETWSCDKPLPPTELKTCAKYAGTYVIVQTSAGLDT